MTAGEPLDAPDEALYREVAGRFATGVTVVTTEHLGLRHGMTVNSLASVSLDPLLVLFCCVRTAALHDPLLASGVWGVSILGVGQEPLARLFATREMRGGEQFVGLACTRGARTGVPLLDGGLGWLECRTVATYDGGDHTIVVGSVVDAVPGDDVPPLLYFRRGYGRLGT